ncbi:pilus assembly FimT family protein [Profundibacter sp.]
MISRSEPGRVCRRTAGLSLLEALIALAILAMVMGLSASAFRGPSPALRLQKQASGLIQTATTLRQRAIRDGRSFTMQTQGLTCETTGQPLVFFPNGTASGPDLCLTADTRQTRLRVNALTGRLAVVSK